MSAKRRFEWLTELRGPGVAFRYRALDIRELDGDRLIESDQIGDNVIAILARLRDHKEAVRRIVAKIAVLAGAERETALKQLVILSGLRSLVATAVEKEIQKVPIFIDIMEHALLGPPFKKGLAEGRQEGKREGELTILRRLIEKRFGAIPHWAEERLANRSTVELEDLSVRLLDAQNIEDLLP